MKLLGCAGRRPFTTLVLVVALGSGGVLGLYRVRAAILSPHRIPRSHADLGSIGTRAKLTKGNTVGRLESRFHQQNEQRNQGQSKIVLTSPKVMDVAITQPYVCHIHSQRHVNVRSFENGYITEIKVREGQEVKKGDVMFKIARAKEDVAKAESDVSDVVAPFAGLLGRLQKQAGSFVKEGDVLTTLSDNAVMWVYFNVPERAYLEYMANPKQRDEDKIELVMANQTKFPQPGKIGAIEAQFNSETGTIAFRADFPNPDRLLRHGQTGTIQIHRKLHAATVIPMQATYELLDKRYVYVVDKDDVVHQREIHVQNETNDFFVIKKGLGVGDRIVLEGIREVRDGEKVEYEFRPPEEVLRKVKNQAD